MNDIGIVTIISMLGFLFLAVSGFASYRLSWKKSAQMALTWFAIFLGMFVVVSLFYEA